jgi:hypothetical protein
MQQVYVTRIVHAKIVTVDRIAVVAIRAADTCRERRRPLPFFLYMRLTHIPDFSLESWIREHLFLQYPTPGSAIL